MKRRKPRKQPNAPQKEGKPFFAKRGAQPDVQAKEEGFFQPKLTIGKPGDRYEQEADRVADAVVNPASAGSPDAQTVRKKGKLQRMEEEEPQAKLQRQEEEEAAQPKLQLQEEEEAQTKLQRQEEEEEEAMQTKLQRQEEEEEAAQPKVQLQEEEEAQAKLEGKPGRTPLVQRLADNKGKGRPLPPDVRRSMEGPMGADFSGVRVHTDAEAVQMSEDLGAQAFTHGGDVYFNEGKYNPASSEGKHLLAHELTHVVQQGKATPKQ